MNNHQTIKQLATGLLLAAFMLLNGTAQTYNWNGPSGLWDIVTPNWTGAGSIWVDGAGNTANFDNTATATTITLSGSRTAGAVTVGDTTANNFANYTITGGTSLSASSFTLQGSSGNGGNYAGNPATTLNIPTMKVAGDVAVGRATLQITGGSLYANRIISAAGSADWADVILAGGTVWLTNGVAGNANTTTTFELDLNGGTLYTPSLTVADRESGGNALLNWNGSTVVATVNTGAFVTLYGGAQYTYVGNGGAIINTFDGTTAHNIVIGVGLNQSGSSTGGLTKLGTGKLTLNRTNTYAGATLISAGTLALLGGSAYLSGTTNITVAANAIYDVSGKNGYKLVGTQSLYGGGTINGTVSASAGAQVGAGYFANGLYATNTLNNNLTNTAGALICLGVGTVYNSSNDLIKVTGTLTLNGTVFHLRAPAPSVNLDTNADYVLMTAATIYGSPSSLPVWEVMPLNAGSFLITNTATQVLLHYSTTLPPVITTQPVSQTNGAGSTVTFSVTATGSVPLSYQWQASGGTGFTNLTDGGMVSGSATSTLTITGVTTNNSLTYQVIVTNANGSVTSAPPAALWVFGAPFITAQPASQYAYPGDSVSLSANAAGTLPISYQWQAGAVGSGIFTNLVNEPQISGVAGNNLTLTNVTDNWSLDYRLIATNIYGSATSAVATLTVPAGWYMVWNDEFNGTNLDTTKWTPFVGNDTGGNVWYTGRTNNLYVANGVAHLVAQQESLGGFAYTSAQLRSDGLYSKQYGLIVARIRQPVGSGFWPAWWMLGQNYDTTGWPYCGEMDIMECFGDPTHILGSLHYADINGQNTSQGNYYTLPTPGDTTANYHTYSVQWTSNSIIWQVDGLNILNWTSWGATNGPFAYPVPFNQPFFFLLDLAVNTGTIVNTTFPSEMQVDYVRVYDRSPLPPTGLAAAAGTNQVNLHWTWVSGATGYNVKRATVSGGPYITLASSLTTNYVDPGVVTGTTYFYVVSAVGAWGESADSALVNLTLGPTLLINGDFGSGATQTGAAVLGSAGDVWNALSTVSGTLVDSSNNLTGVGFNVTDQGLYLDTAGTAMDTATANLMSDYAFGYTSPTTVILSLTGLTKYLNCAFALVVYSAGNTGGQGAALNLTGASGGNSAATLTTTAASRQLSSGLGVAYQEFTGLLANGTLTLTASANGSAFTPVNGFQLQVMLPAPPVIATGPTSQTNIAGNTVSFNVVASGTAPLSYQWQAQPAGGGAFTNLGLGGQISGATSNVLTIANLTTNWALAYQVIVTNAYGSVTSTPPAMLTVYAPAIGLQRNGQGGFTLTWSGGKLLQATNLFGPWTTNFSVSSPLTVTPEPGLQQQYYRVQSP